MKKFLRPFLICSLILISAFAGEKVPLSGQQETSCPPQQPGFFCAFRGHNDSVLSVAFSPDGILLGSGSSDRTVKIWEITTHTLVKTLDHITAVAAVAFSPDGKFIASGSGDGVVRLWEVATGREVRAFKGHIAGIDSVAFHPKDKLLASGACGHYLQISCTRGEVRLWDVAKGALVRTLTASPSSEGSPFARTSTTFNPEGTLLAAGYTAAIYLWNVATGREARIIRYAHLSDVYSLAFSPDGKLLVSGSRDGDIKLWDVATGRAILTLQAHSTDSVSSVGFSPDGKFLAAGSRDIKVWERTSGREVQTFPLGNLTVHAITFSPDGRFLASAHGVYPDVRIWYVGNLAAGR